MSTFDPRLLESGFKPIGLCSSLWVSRDGSFRGGFYLYQGRLHLVIRIDAERYFVNEIKRDQVDNCLRGGITLFELGTECRNSGWWNKGRLSRATLMNRLILWWRLRTDHFSTLPNYYYLWNGYIYSR